MYFNPCFLISTQFSIRIYSIVIANCKKRLIAFNFRIFAQTGLVFPATCNIHIRGECCCLAIFKVSMGWPIFKLLGYGIARAFVIRYVLVNGVFIYFPYLIVFLVIGILVVIRNRSMPKTFPYLSIGFSRHVQLPTF